MGSSGSFSAVLLGWPAHHLKCLCTAPARRRCPSRVHRLATRLCRRSSTTSSRPCFSARSATLYAATLASRARLPASSVRTVSLRSPARAFAARRTGEFLRRAVVELELMSDSRADALAIVSSALSARTLCRPSRRISILPYRSARPQRVLESHHTSFNALSATGTRRKSGSLSKRRPGSLVSPCSRGSFPNSS